MNHEKDSLKNALAAQLAGLEIPPYNGYAARLTALNTLSKENNSIAIASWFILLLFIVLECAPVLVNWLSSPGAYDYALFSKVNAARNTFVKEELHARQAWENEKQFVTETGVHRATEAIKAEKSLIEAKFKKKLSDTSRSSGSWNEQVLD